MCPELIAAFRDAGCEIAAHGRTNAERQGQLPEAEERKLIAEATGEIARHEGKPPRGWLGPWISESDITPDLLKEAGYAYVLDWCHDDRPVALETRAGPLLSVPYPQEANDANAIVVRRMSADGFADLVVDQFDEMLEQARDIRAGLSGIAASARHRPGAPAAPSAPRLRAHRKTPRADLADARRRHRRYRGGRIRDFLTRSPGVDPLSSAKDLGFRDQARSCDVA